jgi:signal peptidase
MNDGGSPRDGEHDGGATTGADDPPAPDTGTSDDPEGVTGWLRWAWTVDHGPVMFVREMLSTMVLVAAVGALLFAISGVWPPMVAVKSGSMEPHMQKGDLVLVVEDGRFTPGGAGVAGTGVVPQRQAAERGYTKFGDEGDVIVYRRNNGTMRDPVIHRAMFFVEDGENWYDRAEAEHLPPGVDSCRELTNCPAPNAGFVTKGDNPVSNQYYDQAQGLSAPAHPSWVEGKALVRVPWLGWIRLTLAETSRGLAALFGVGVLGGRARRAAG